MSAYIYYIRQGSWVPGFKEHHKSPFASQDVRYKKKKSFKQLLKEAEEKTSVKKQKTEELRVTINNISDQNGTRSENPVGRVVSEIVTENNYYEDISDDENMDAFNDEAGWTYSDHEDLVDNDNNRRIPEIMDCTPAENIEGEIFLTLDAVGQTDEEQYRHLLGADLWDKMECDDLLEEEELPDSTLTELDKTVLRLKALKLKDVGPITKKYEDRTQLLYTTAIKKDNPGAMVATMVGRLEGYIEGSDTYNCDTCDINHKLQMYETCRIVIGDSLINWRNNRNIRPADPEHVDYYIRSGQGLEQVLTAVVRLYKWEPRPLHIVLLMGANDCLKGKSWQYMKEKVEEFDLLLEELDSFHCRFESKSKLYVCSIPASPEICRYGKAQVRPEDMEAKSDECQTLVSFNHWIEERNLKRHPSQVEKVPCFNQYGYRTKKNSFGVIKWSKKKGDWRSSEGPYPMHPSDKVMAHILSVLTGYVHKMANMEERKWQPETPKERLQRIGLDCREDYSLHPRNAITFDLEGIKPHQLEFDLRQKLGKRKLDI